MMNCKNKNQAMKKNKMIYHHQVEIDEEVNKREVLKMVTSNKLLTRLQY